ncbi:hypothetical protein L917_06062, partial [Phytophthora nicotianae]
KKNRTSPMRLSSFIVVGAAVVNLLTSGSVVVAAFPRVSDVSAMSIAPHRMDQGATNGGKRLLRYHSNNNRGGDEDIAEERGIFDFKNLEMLTNLARLNKANDLDSRLDDFFQALIKAKVNPSNIHHTRLDQDDYLELRQLFRTWYTFYHRAS